MVLIIYLRLLLGAGATFRKSSHRPGSLPLLITIMILLSQSRSQPLFEPLAIPAAVLAAAALVLFQWATNSIQGKFFSYLGDDDIPQFVFQGGPFAYVRNPFYASYILTNTAVAMAYPSWIGGGAALVSIAILWAAALYEERKFARSPCAAEHQLYIQRTGRFLPRLSHG